MNHNSEIPRLSQVCLNTGGPSGSNTRSSLGSFVMNEAVEIMTRNSLNSLRRISNLSMASLSSYKKSSCKLSIDDRNWSWKYLRDQFQEKEIEEQCKRYFQKLRNGYFTSFVLLNFVIFFSHVAILLYLEKENSNTIPREIVPYILCGSIPLTTLLVKDSWSRKHDWFPIAISYCVIVLLFLSDVIASLSSDSFPPLRPAHITYNLVACYGFLPLVENNPTYVLAITTTVGYLIVLSLNTYRYSQNLFLEVLSEIIYFLSLNSIGVYLRYINEIEIRRMFLDSRACVETTMKLNYQKFEEEQLMLSILPPHVELRVKNDIRSLYEFLKSKERYNPQRQFTDLYIEKHYNVSILYADIVNYTKMTCSLPVKKLVEILNELFGKFDEASEERQVLRIKFLGDCYYCVAGIRQTGISSATHAKNTVNLGLDMIEIIRDVRDQHKLDIDMRIGIHSGRILSGLVGSCKWQYDIWSKDVVIANHMEQTGKPSKVHITQHTLKYLNDEYPYERGFGEEKDSFLEKNNIITYLISPTNKVQTELPIYNRNSSTSSSPKRYNRGRVSRFRKTSEADYFMSVSNRRGAFMDESKRKFQEMSTEIDSKMSEEIEKLPLGKYMQWFHSEHIQPLVLFFRNLSWEKPYLKQYDPMYKFYILISFVVSAFVLMIQAPSLPKDHIYFWITVPSVVTLLLLLIPIAWFHYFWKNVWNSNDDLVEPNNIYARIIFNISKTFIKNALLRTILYLFICFSLLISCIIDLPECHIIDISNRTVIYPMKDMDCTQPWRITESLSLVVILTFIFLRIHFLLKFFIGIVIILMYVYIVVSFRPEIFKNSETWNTFLYPQVAHILGIIYLTITLHILDRQTEYMNRLDYQWKLKLSEEREQAATTDIINTMLLHNILPIHVAKFYLNPNTKDRTSYYEEYECVSVMFASITEYTLGVDDDTEDSEFTMLTVLNNVICDFDKLLMEHEGIKIEKIKMAGWTYMAACGLDPGKKDSEFLENNSNLEAEVVVTLANFATKLIKALNSINEETQQQFKLRIGISHGNVFAGVVGAKKPLYDIWGNTVNMASRMDSTGISGRIQLTEETAFVLMQNGIQCEHRGNIFVKGKDHFVTTYFLKLDQSLNMVQQNRFNLTKL